MPRSDNTQCAARTCCIVDGCRNSKRNRYLSFFSLPRDEEKRKRWLEIVNRTDLLEKSNLKHYSHFVCSAHFEKQMMTQKPQLKPEALPTKYLPGESNSTCTAETCTTDVSTQTDFWVEVDIISIKTEETEAIEANGEVNDSTTQTFRHSKSSSRKRCVEAQKTSTKEIRVKPS